MAWNGQVVTTQRTWLSKVLEADPDFYAKRKDELLYKFSNGKEFRGDPNRVATAYPDE
jgi:hypothetical protein